MPSTFHAQVDNWNESTSISDLKLGDYYHTCTVIDKNEIDHTIQMKDTKGRVKWFNSSVEQYNSFEIGRNYSLGIYNDPWTSYICISGLGFPMLIFGIFFGIMMLKESFGDRET